MADSGLGLDPFQQVVNVQWMGVVSDFAVGGTARDATQEGPIGVFYSKKSNDENMSWASTHMDPGSPSPPPATDHRPVGAGGMGPRETGMWENAIKAMVGGKITAREEGEKDQKILVAGGVRSYMVGLDDIGTDEDGQISTWHYTYAVTAILFWSDDGGKTWTEVSNPVTASSEFPQQVAVLYLAFDPENEIFYGDVRRTGSQAGGIAFDVFAERILIESVDGKNWTIAGSEKHIITSGTVDFVGPFLDRIKSIEDNRLTEVINTDADPPVKLSYSTVEVESGAFGGNLKLLSPWKIEPAPTGDLKEGCVSLDAVPSSKIYSGIAYAGGRFLIAGSLLADAEGESNYTVQAYVSDDNGRSWKKTLDDSETFLIADTINNDPPFCAGSCGCAGA